MRVLLFSLFSRGKTPVSLHEGPKSSPSPLLQTEAEKELLANTYTPQTSGPASSLYSLLFSSPLPLGFNLSLSPFLASSSSSSSLSATPLSDSLHHSCCTAPLSLFFSLFLVLLLDLSTTTPRLLTYLSSSPSPLSPGQVELSLWTERRDKQKNEEGNRPSPLTREQSPAASVACQNLRALSCRDGRGDREQASESERKTDYQ